MDDWMVALLVSGVVMLGGALGVAGALAYGLRGPQSSTAAPRSASSARSTERWQRVSSSQ